jgi:hypothetical protein
MALKTAANGVVRSIVCALVTGVLVYLLTGRGWHIGQLAVVFLTVFLTVILGVILWVSVERR